MTIKLKTIDELQYKRFIRDEAFRRPIIKDPEVLITKNPTYYFTKTYLGIYKSLELENSLPVSELIGFVCLQKENPNVLINLYITPRYRRQRIAIYVLEELKINSLACLRNNIPGINLYKSLGFKSLPPNSENDPYLFFIK